MKLSLSWLKKHLETDENPDNIGVKLTDLGHVVDDLKNTGALLQNFKIVEVTHVERHPNADRLSICQVNTGDQRLQVVCGASNVRSGMKAVLAQPGMKIPNSGIVLKETKIRDVESFGMLCSLSELGLSEEESEGIIDVPAHAPLGMDYVDFLSLNDVVYDLDITPNRGDCLSHYGIARDLAAAGFGKLKESEVNKILEQCDLPIKVSQSLGDQSSACPAFAVRMIKNVKNVKSPTWLENRLKSIGLKPISALVDITNFIMHDMGRPMHVYDGERVKGDLVIRFAYPDETFKALDEKVYTLNPTMMVVADQSGPVALAGIIGSADSGCCEETTTVILESAIFDPTRIARTGRELGIHSDARHRFERGVDPQIVEEMLDRATHLIIDICGGEPTQRIRIGNPVLAPKSIILQSDAVKRLCGVEIDAVTQITILESLGFKVSRTLKNYTVEVPSWRHDCLLEEDLVEEIMRIYGYDHLIETPLPLEAVTMAPQVFETPSRNMNQLRIARRLLSAAGYHEVITWSFLTQQNAELFGGGGSDLRIINPISADLSVMRPTVLPNLLDHLKSNRDRSIANVMLYEVGPIFKNASKEGQKTMISGVRFGSRNPVRWDQGSESTDIFDIKSDVLGILEVFDIDQTKLQVSAETTPWYHPGRSFKIQLGPKNTLALGGELHPQILTHLGLKPGVLGFEIFFSDLPLSKSKKLSKGPLTLYPYQTVERDFAFIVDEACPAQNVVQVIRKVNPELIASVALFDVFKGDGVPSGKKSLALTVRLEPKKATLKEAEILKVSEDIIASVQQMTGGVLRT